MDLTGGKLYATVMESLLPHLCNSRDLPPMMRALQDENAAGTANGHGFYDYSPQEAEEWDRNFLEYSVEAGELTGKYF
jgi:3-hydroxybutyryl-CoA dehydrogenase